MINQYASEEGKNNFFFIILCFLCTPRLTSSHQVFPMFFLPFAFLVRMFFFFCSVPEIIVIAINSICVPRCFSRAAAALALQKTNIHRRQAQSSRAVMRGGSLPLSCVTVLKSLHGELINFFSASSVLVCLRKTKTARVPGVSGSTHPLWCHLLCSHYFSLPSSATSTPPPCSPCNPHSCPCLFHHQPRAKGH